MSISLLLLAVAFFIILLVLLILVVLEDITEDPRKKILYKQLMLVLVAIEIAVVWVVLEILSKS